MAERKTVKTYITSTGAQQYGSAEDARRHSMKVLRRFIKNPNAKNYTLLQRMNAAENAAVAKKFRSILGNDNAMSDLYDDMEKSNLSEKQKKTIKSYLRLDKKKQKRRNLAKTNKDILLKNIK